MNDDVKLPALVSGGQVRGIIPQSFDEAWRIGNAVCVAGMAPKGLDTPEKATVAILHGLEVGMSPMVALQSIAVIGGRPCIWGDGALGLVQGSGKMETIKETVEGTDDNRVAICRVVRRGDPEPKIGRFSVQDAKTAKLWTKSGPWTDYPERMLKMRARAWALRDGFADVLKGLAIAEEVRDIDHDPNEPKRTPPKPPASGLKNTQFAEIAKKNAPPVPPKPPKFTKDGKEIVGNVAGYDIVDEDTGAGVTFEDTRTPGELLSELDDSLATAKTVEEIDEIYDAYDLEAILQSMPQGEEFVGVAIGIKRRHLKRMTNEQG